MMFMTSTHEPDRRLDPDHHDGGTIVRLALAIAVFASGLIHLQLYLDGYRDFPNDNLGRSFLLNVVASVIVAVALVARRDVVVRLAAGAILVGTLIAFAVSRTDGGIFGFAERGLSPSPQAALSLVLEIGGLLLLAATFVPAIGAGRSLPPRVALGAASALVVVAVAGAVLWGQTESVSTADAPPATAPATATATTMPSDASTSSEVATTVAPATSAPTSNDTATSVEPATTDAPSSTVGAPATSAPTAPAPTAGAPAEGAAVVSITDFTFVEGTIEVPVGTTVEWVNDDSFDHSVVADDGSFESETMAAGDTFSFTFDTPGEFPYICGIHPSMIGTVIVTG